MKKFVVALCVGAAACNSPQDSLTGNVTEEGEVASESVSEMLKAGKPEVCAHPDVKHFWVQTLKQGELSPEMAGDVEITQEDIDAAVAAAGDPELSLIQATETDPAVGRVACQLRLKTTANAYTTHTVTYTLSPSLESSSDFIMNWQGVGEGAWTSIVRSQAYASASNRLSAERRAAQQRESEEANMGDASKEEFVWPENASAGQDLEAEEMNAL